MTIFEQLNRFEITPVFPGEEADKLARGFNETVRCALLAALPQCNTRLQVERFDCPYCGLAKGRRAMQMDHIIPRALYMKYQAMKQSKTLLPYLEEGTTKIRSFLDTQATDLSNLVLCCASCNREKSDRLYSPKKFRAIAERIDAGNAVREKMLRAREISKEMEGVFTQNRHLHTFIVRQHTWNLRDAPPYNLYSQILHRAGPADSIGQTLRRQIGALVNVVGNFMIDWIPRTPQDSWDQLQDAQMRIVEQYLKGYLCLYCLGLHDDDAFEIDHIRPQPEPERRTLETNNEGGNLIPVCKSCNASKGDRYRIARDFFPKRAADRAGKRITGIESLRNRGVSVDAALRAAHRRQFEVFEAHLEAQPNTRLPRSFERWMRMEIEDAPT
ncbi:HNH endonuclease signature motif containing protein [Burkholderia plantarii]|uniref:HNH endonuclease signature motif containing protein n=1 Tax=Burkholderia plantarii TaxID=41899 RepID=UPI0018DB6093|nr:HNH endonuclease signature motif containing protein [Burkholderia plantarii]MBI0331311.1 HNH endonuclease [Burkholderia plantarii]